METTLPEETQKDSADADRAFLEKQFQERLFPEIKLEPQSDSERPSKAEKGRVKREDKDMVWERDADKEDRDERSWTLKRGTPANTMVIHSTQTPRITY